MSPEQLAPAKPARQGPGPASTHAAWPVRRPGRGRAPTSRRGSERGRRPPPDWGSLIPRGPYARWGKTCLRTSLLVLVLPVAAALSLPIVLVNWALFRDLRLVLFRQPRVGRRGRVFMIFKFRTMRAAKQDDFDSWKEGREGLRVTRFGRLLRNTHLDELPQLLNVLRGEMDFVGPRPEMIEIHRWACERIPEFEERNALLPGITGFAQITQGYTGMDVDAYRRKLAVDQLYRRKLSLGLDLEILARTAIWMLRGRGWSFRPPASAEAGALLRLR